MPETTYGTFDVSPPQELAERRVLQALHDNQHKPLYHCARCGALFDDHQVYGRHVARGWCRPPKPVKKRLPRQLTLFASKAKASKAKGRGRR